VTGGQTVQGTVTLTAPALPGGAIVALTSVYPNLVTAPAMVTVPAGSASVNFSISTSAVNSTQAAGFTAFYGDQGEIATLSIIPAGAPFFSMLSAAPLFQPTGTGSCQTYLMVTPNAGNVTYTAEAGTTTFDNGAVTNQGQTITFSSLQSGNNFFVCGSTDLSVSSGSLTFTLRPGSLGYLHGTLSGTLSVTGTPIAGGASVTLSGAISGTYLAN